MRGRMEGWVERIRVMMASRSEACFCRFSSFSRESLSVVSSRERKKWRAEEQGCVCMTKKDKFYTVTHQRRLVKVDL